MIETLKAIAVEGTELHIIHLNRGAYKIDGGIIIVSSYQGEDIQCKDLNVVALTRSTVITHYENAEGEKLSVDGYIFKIKVLTEKGKIDDDWYCFDDLDDEYAYKKFCKTWTQIKREVIQESDPYLFETIPIVMDTGNEYITSFPSTEYIKCGLYEYDRTSSTMAITTKAFNDVGMKFDPGINNYSQTEGKKFWGKSNHSHLEYVTAFNKYPFGAAWNISGSRRGTLEQCRAMYDSDVKAITRIVKVGYSAHFRTDIAIDYAKLLLYATSVVKGIASIYAYKASADKKLSAYYTAEKLVTLIENAMADSKLGE